MIIFSSKRYLAMNSNLKKFKSLIDFMIYFSCKAYNEFLAISNSFINI